MRSFLHAVRGALLGVRDSFRVSPFILLDLADRERVGLEEL